MWLLHFIPDSLIHLAILVALVSGVVLFILASVGSFFPTFKPYTTLIKTVSVIIIIVSSYLFGGYGTELEWRHRVEEMEGKVKVAEAKSKDANAKLAAKAKAKVKVITEYKTVYKTQIKEIAAKIDQDCQVDPEAIKILNDSANQSRTKK